MLTKDKQYVRANGKPFLFGVKVGTFKKYTGANWPFFDLGDGKTCMVNATDDQFVPAEDAAEQERLRTGHA